MEICAYVQFNDVVTRTDTLCALLPFLCDFFLKLNADCRQLYLLLFSHMTVVWAKLACGLHIVLLILLVLLEQTASTCDPCLCESHPTYHNCALISFTDCQTVLLIVSSYSLFHLFCLCLPVWVPGFLEDAPALVTDVALLGAVLLAALPVLWCPVLASVNLFD